MNKSNFKKVLIIGPSLDTKGGISSVIINHKSTKLWDDWGCLFLPSYHDKNNLYKIFYFFKSFFYFLYVINDFNIIHIHFSQPTSAFRKSLFFIIGKLYKKIIIVHYHGNNTFKKTHNISYCIYKILFKYADSIIVISDYWKNLITNTFSLIHSKVIIIYNPVKFVPDNTTYKENIILFAGSIIESKGYRDLIFAFKLISNIHKDWYLYFAGDGKINDAKKLVNQLGLDNKIKFLGWIEGKVKHDYFQKAKIFCLPSYAEGFPMAILDAFSYNIPVIASNLKCYEETLLDYRNLLFFNVGNYEDLADCLKLLIIDTNLSNSIIANNKILIKNKFNLSIVIKELDKLYTSL
jgi:glycosyltransferase involved in cell wall biosynthesis